MGGNQMELDENTAVVVLSGGQDSATCLAGAMKLYEKVHTLTFDYGQRHRREMACAGYLSKVKAEAETHIVIPVVSLILAQSALTDTTAKQDISAQHELDPSLPASFVPGRNYIFLGLAAIYAYRLKAKFIVTGVCETDYSGYPDCREVTIIKINDALNLAMDCTFVIETPLMHINKGQTVIKMKSLGTLDWYKYTQTCYEGKWPPCGECPACKLRAKGFKEADIADPLLTVMEEELDEKNLLRY
jgi:7-cyano-7-deazaguanine synthase